MKIICKNNNGTIDIITPTREALLYFTVQQIAEKDVPYGAPYLIVENDSIIEYLSIDERYSMEWDDAVIPDGFGGESSDFDAALLSKYLNGEENV